MDMMRVETGLKRKKTPGKQFTPITAKTNRYGQRRKMARYKRTDTMQKDCVMK